MNRASYYSASTIHSLQSSGVPTAYLASIAPYGLTTYDWISSIAHEHKQQIVRQLYNLEAGPYEVTIGGFSESGPVCDEPNDNSILIFVRRTALPYPRYSSKTSIVLESGSLVDGEFLGLPHHVIKYEYDLPAGNHTHMHVIDKTFWNKMWSALKVPDYRRKLRFSVESTSTRMLRVYTQHPPGLIPIPPPPNHPHHPHFYVSHYPLPDPFGAGYPNNITSSNYEQTYRSRLAVFFPRHAQRFTDLANKHDMIIFGEFVRDVVDEASGRETHSSTVLRAAVQGCDLVKFQRIVCTSGFQPCGLFYSPTSFDLPNTFSDAWVRGDLVVVLYSCSAISPKTFVMRQPVTTDLIFIERETLYDMFPHLTIAKQFAFNDLRDNGNCNVFLSNHGKWTALGWKWEGFDNEITKYEHRHPFAMRLVLASNSIFLAEHST